MATHLIVDGYNVIRRSPRHADLERLGLDAGRRSLIDRLVAYKRATGHRLTVVFDGVAAGDATERRSRDRGVEVIFTARGTTADEAIVRLARDAASGAAVVVTADLALARAVARRGAAILSPEAFEARLDLATFGSGGPPAGAAAGGRLLDPDEPDADDAGSSGRRRKRGNPRKAPKAVRRAAARLRKV